MALEARSAVIGGSDSLWQRSRIEGLRAFVYGLDCRAFSASSTCNRRNARTKYMIAAIVKCH